MVSDVENRILSEKYADLLIEINKTKAITQRFSDATVHPLNFLLSLVNIPVEYITNHTVSELGYGVFPSILGLISQESIQSPDFNRFQLLRKYNLRGQGVLIAVIDTGIDYTNPIFRYPDGTTRIAAIWDQTIQSNNPPKGLLYGTEYQREQINLALKSENPYELVPSKDEIGHGTMLAGIAGGNEVLQNRFYGIAPEAEFLIVKLKYAKKYLKEFFCIPEGAASFQENDIAYALNYVLNGLATYAKPIALCIGINTSEGSHVGRGTFNNYFSYVANIPGIAIAIGAGNEGNAKRHYYGAANQQTGYDKVLLNVGQNENNFIMELWGDVPDMFSIDILSPLGELIVNETPLSDKFQEITFKNIRTIIYMDYQMVESQTGSQLIFFRFINPTPGIWEFTMNKKGDLNVEFHIWLPMEGFISEDTYFIHPDPYTTVLSLATTTTTISVTAYDEADDSLYPKASKGYSRAGSITPVIAAPGVNIVAPTLEQSFRAFSGTSISTAYMTGVAAMFLEWGIVKGNSSNMSTGEIKSIVIAGARRNLNMTYPNQDWGYGILDLDNIFQTLNK